MRRRKGFTLLEVILALAILGIAVAILGEALRQGIRSAQHAKATTRAGILCESKLNEVLAGIQSSAGSTSGTFDDQGDPTIASWSWSIETEPVQQQGLLAVRVTVRQDLPAEQHPAEVSLTRWIVDPQSQTTTPSDTTSPTPGTGQTQ